MFRFVVDCEIGVVGVIEKIFEWVWMMEFIFYLNLGSIFCVECYGEECFVFLEVVCGELFRYDLVCFV